MTNNIPYTGNYDDEAGERMSAAVRDACAMLRAAMHVNVVNSVVINRPVADVSQYAADPDNAPLCT